MFLYSEGELIVLTPPPLCALKPQELLSVFKGLVALPWLHPLHIPLISKQAEAAKRTSSFKNDFIYDYERWHLKTTPGRPSTSLRDRWCFYPGPFLREAVPLQILLFKNTQ